MNELTIRQITGIQIVAIGLAIFASYAQPIIYVRLIAEDGWGEYATSVAFLAAAIIFFGCYWRTVNDRRAQFWYIVVALGCFFVGMEEISWGQRIIGLRTPEAFAQLNNQYELTIHNLIFVESVTPYNTVIPLTVFTYGVVISAAGRFIASFERLLQRLRFVYPPLFLAPSFLVAAFLMSAPVEKSSEIGEMFTGFGMLLLASYHAHQLPSGAGSSRTARRRLVFGYVFLFLAYIILGYWLVPTTIESAYHGRSFQFLNDALSGSAVHTLEKYLNEWADFRNLILVLLVILMSLSLPFVARYWRHSSLGLLLEKVQSVFLIVVAFASGVVISQLTGPHESFRYEINAYVNRALNAKNHRVARTLLEFISVHKLTEESDLLFHQGRFYNVTGDKTAATAAFERALELELEMYQTSGNPMSAQRLGQICNHLGEHDEAKRYWTHALDRFDLSATTAQSPEDQAEAHLGKADTFRLLRDPNAAISEYVTAALKTNLGFRKKKIWVSIGEVLNECQSDELRRGPRWDFGVHWERVLGMIDAKRDGAEIDWCSLEW